MYLYENFFSKLDPYFEFDPKAFIADGKAGKDICGFFLSLSLMSNDLKTISIFIRIIGEEIPLPSNAPKRASGELAGLQLHVLRLNVGIMFELFNLISKNRKLLDDSFFKDVLRSTEPMTKECWQNIVEASDENRDFKKKDSNPFYMIRNKTVFHYEKDDILEGYKEGFVKNALGLPCISRGGRIINSRLYFADRAIDGYISKKIGMTRDEFFKKIGALNESASISLLNLATAFIIKRGCSFKKAKQD